MPAAASRSSSPGGLAGTRDQTTVSATEEERYPSPGVLPDASRGAAVPGADRQCGEGTSSLEGICETEGV